MNYANRVSQEGRPLPRRRSRRLPRLASCRAAVRAPRSLRLPREHLLRELTEACRCATGKKRQMACKPGSVPRLRGWMTIPLGRPLPDASRDPPGRQPGNRPCAVPIWSCSRWGLPCRLRCRTRGALLPHRFTLASDFSDRRFDFCGAIPGVAPAGRYPAPCLRGARTFLPPSPCDEDARPSSHLTRGP
jgi:hypothetical protein